MIDLDPTDALALTLHHSPGTQALLLGSGISRSAGVPTGWDITVDLIRRLAAVQGVTDQADWAAWYKATYRNEPSYSDILDALAGTPSERRAIIHAYIEASESDEPRQPTPAHRAIAKLVSLGAIKVILTTNFDRLLESALRDAGIEPTVIASADGLKGATPLVHSKCTVIKLHGDYLDARIKNTADELEHYDPAMDQLLDRVLDEFGLIVAGWSGEWDTALKAAVLRSSSRRYPFYWAARGVITPAADDLLKHRGGRAVQIEDADSFFTQVCSKLQALQAVNKPHPLSTAMIVAEGKKLCRDPLATAEWSDLLAREIERFSSFVRGPDYHPAGAPTNQTMNPLVTKIMARTEALRRLALVGTRWGSDDAFKVLLRAIAGMTFSDMDTSGFKWPNDLRILGAAVCFQWAIGAALLREDWGRVASLAHYRVTTARRERWPAIEVLPIAAIPEQGWKWLTGFETRYTPHSDFFAPIFIADAADIVVSPSEADEAWDDLEFFISIEFAHHRLKRSEATGVHFWSPPGRFLWRTRPPSFSDRLAEIHALNGESPAIQSGLFGGEPSKAHLAATVFHEEVSKYTRGW